MTEITQEEAAQAAGHSVKAATTYVVLAQKTVSEGSPLMEEITGGGVSEIARDFWQEVGSFTARTAEAAIRQYAEKSGSTTPLVLVAVPARSWAPMRVQPKTVTTLEVEAVS